MASEDYLFTAIRGMLIDANMGYTDDQIFQAFQSDMNYPVEDNFVTFTELSRMLTSITPVKAYDGENESRSILTLNKVNIQVDFYGDTAADSSSYFFNYLTGFATDYLEINSPDVSMGELQNFSNLTLEFDSNIFVKKYTQRFVVYLRQTTVYNSNMADTVTPDQTFFQ